MLGKLNEQQKDLLSSMAMALILWFLIGESLIMPLFHEAGGSRYGFARILIDPYLILDPVSLAFIGIIFFGIYRTMKKW